MSTGYERSQFFHQNQQSKDLWILRRARSLFSPGKLRHLTLAMPRPLPFEGVEFEARQSMKYRSEIDVEKLISHARQELERGDPEACKVFLLAVGLFRRAREWTVEQAFTSHELVFGGGPPCEKPLTVPDPAEGCLVSGTEAVKRSAEYSVNRFGSFVSGFDTGRRDRKPVAAQVTFFPLPP